MLVNGTVLYFIHHVELSFKVNEIFASLRLCVDDALLVLLQCVYNLEEVPLSEEELKVSLAALLYFRRIRRIVRIWQLMSIYLPLIVSIGMRRPSWSK